MAELTDAQKEHYGNLFASSRDEMLALWKVAMVEWDAFKFGREKFGVPLIDAIWTTDDMQEGVNLQQIVDIASGVIVDVLSGQRKVDIDVQLGTAEFEALPSDQFLIRIVGGKPVLVEQKDPAAGPVNVSGQLGAWQLAVVAGIITVAILGYQYMEVVKKRIEETIAKIRAATQKDLQTKCGDLVAAGTYTADKCKDLVKEIQDGQAAIIKADTENKKAEPPSPGWDTVKAGLYVVLGLAAVGLGLYAVQTFAPSRRAMANPSFDEDDEGEPEDQTSDAELHEAYVIQDARGAMRGHGYELAHEGRVVSRGDFDDLVAEANRRMEKDQYYPGLYYMNERGTIDALDSNGVMISNQA